MKLFRERVARNLLKSAKNGRGRRKMQLRERERERRAEIFSGV